jgi:two-component system chemotaxis response regulator CheB
MNHNQMPVESVRKRKEASVSTLHRDPAWPRWMPGERVRVLLAESNVVERQSLKQVLTEDPEIEMVGTAATGDLLLERLEPWQPHLLVLGANLPGMENLQVLRTVRNRFPGIRILLLCGADERGATTSLEALALGASDCLPRPGPTPWSTEEITRMAQALIPKIKSIVANYCRRVEPKARVGQAGSRDVVVAPVVAERRKAPRPLSVRKRLELVVIGVSTGGPNALATLVPALPKDFPLPILLVQHMPPMFTSILADRLNSMGALRAREAQDGDELEPGLILIAPGDHHLQVATKGTRRIARVSQGPPENSCRPAADVLFRSASEVCGAGVLGVVLTGMGKDGLQGATALRQSGATILAQDEATSVVWGMPGFVVKAGLADQVLAIEAIGPAMATLARMEGEQRV